MKLNLINPNTTLSMTRHIASAAAQVAAENTFLRAVSPVAGAPSIEGHLDEAIAAVGVIEQVLAGEAEGCDAHIIACFGDPGLDAAREVARGPVLGIAEAAMRAATFLASRFSVITTLQRTVVIAEHLALKYGVAQQCRRVRSVEIAVLALEDPESDAYQRILAECRLALVEDRAEALVLGCAGMADLAQRLSAELGVPVIDGVGVAVGMAEALVRNGLSTSKRGDFAAPIAKAYSGWAQPFSPEPQA